MKVIKRCMVYLGMALAMCLGSFSAYAEERIAYVATASFGESYAVQSVKHELTMSQWRMQSAPCSEPVASNLIKLSNHFGLASAAPFSVPDWDNV